MVHPPPSLDSGTRTYQSLHNHSNLCVDLNFLHPERENVSTNALVENNGWLPNLRESFLSSKYAVLWFKKSDTVNALI